MTSYLHEMVASGCSDLHLAVGLPVIVRRHGHIEHLDESALSREMVASLVSSLLSDEQREELKLERELDFAYAMPGLARFRVNCFIERNNLAASFRRIPEQVPAMEDLNLPPVMAAICERPRGLVLVTGPTGSGKSTSLAAMMRYINETRAENILTIEDPVEFVHTPHMSVFRQREVGRDTHSFARALRSALRQDPDVILVGEMRDKETIEIALTAAETGHLVFSTLHTRSAPETINRIIDVFSGDEQPQIRAQLSSALICVMSQTLLERADDSGRVAAFETLIVTDAVRNTIREGKVQQLRSVMQTGRSEGMETMDSSLARLALSGTIDVELAREKAQDRRELERLMSGAQRRAGQTPGAGMRAATPVAPAAPGGAPPPPPDGGTYGTKMGGGG